MERWKACNEIEEKATTIKENLDFLFFVSISSYELIDVWDPFR